MVEDLTGLDVTRWRDPGNGAIRSRLALRGKFGTAYESIDRPTG